MDIGFGALIEKFEQYVGKLPTRILVYAIFIAVFAFCTKAIVDNLIDPLLSFFRTPLWGSTLVELVLLAAAVSAGSLAGLYAMASFTGWQAARAAIRNLSKAKQLVSESEAASDKIEQSFSQIEELSAETQTLIGETNELKDDAKDLLTMTITLLRSVIDSNPTISDGLRTEAEAMIDKSETILRSPKNTKPDQQTKLG